MSSRFIRRIQDCNTVELTNKSIEEFKGEDFVMLKEEIGGFAEDLSFQNLFLNFHHLKRVDFSGFDTSRVTNMNNMFKGCNNLETIKFGNNFCISNVIYMEGMFEDCYKLISLDLSMFDTVKVTNMNNMFKGCNNLETIKFGSLFKSTFNTNNDSMFVSCNNLNSVTMNDARYLLNSDIVDILDTIIDHESDLNVQLQFGMNMIFCGIGSQVFIDCNDPYHWLCGLNCETSHRSFKRVFDSSFKIYIITDETLRKKAFKLLCRVMKSVFHEHSELSELYDHILNKYITILDDASIEYDTKIKYLDFIFFYLDLSHKYNNDVVYKWIFRQMYNDATRKDFINTCDLYLNNKCLLAYYLSKLEPKFQFIGGLFYYKVHAYQRAASVFYNILDAYTSILSNISFECLEDKVKDSDTEERFNDVILKLPNESIVRQSEFYLTLLIREYNVFSFYKSDEVKDDMFARLDESLKIHKEYIRRRKIDY